MCFFPRENNYFKTCINNIHILKPQVLGSSPPILLDQIERKEYSYYYKVIILLLENWPNVTPKSLKYSKAKVHIGSFWSFSCLNPTNHHHKLSNIRS